MDKNNKSSEKDEKISPSTDHAQPVKDELVSDGSGGAFSGTEEVVKDVKDQQPLPPDHDTPY